MTTYEALSLSGQFGLVLLGVMTIVVMLFVERNKKK